MAGVVFYAEEWWLTFAPSLGLWHNVSSLTGLVLLGAGTYLLMARVLGAHELRTLMSMLKPGSKKP
jgi:peptidoglycan biosynthesis protein MviN/MurJ (putative lipid II flippase)